MLEVPPSPALDRCVDRPLLPPDLRTVWSIPLCKDKHGVRHIPHDAHYLPDLRKLLDYVVCV